MEELKDIEIIDRYWAGALSDTEKQEVEMRIKNDNTFRQTFDEVKDAIFAVQLAQEDRVRAILKEEQTKLLEQKGVVIPKTAKKPFLLRGMLAAASIAVLVVVGFWFFKKTDSFNFEQKHNTWVKIVRDESAVKDEEKRMISLYGEVEGQKLIEGLKFYESEQFDKAAPILLSINLNNDTLYLYQANTLLKTNNGHQAVKILEKIPNNSASVTEKDWYLAMAYWSINDISNAKQVLKNISDNSLSDWQVKAQKLLQSEPFN